MVERSNFPSASANLWRRARDAGRAGEPGAERLDAMDLAAYLDGGLEPEPLARLERLLVRSPDILDALLESRQTVGAPPVPRDVIRRAQALVPSQRTFKWPMPIKAMSILWTASRPSAAWVGVTAAILLACLAGFELGREGYSNLNAVHERSAEDLFSILVRPADDLL